MNKKVNIQTKEELLQNADDYLKNTKCPNCGKKVDSIYFGKAGIRCDFCIKRNIIEDILFLSKISEKSVYMQPVIESISESGLELTTADGKHIDIPWVRLHIDKDVFSGSVEDFIKKYISLIIFVNRSDAYTFLPHIRPQTIKVEDSNNNDNGKKDAK